MPARPTLPPFSRVVDEHGPAVLRFCASRVGRERAEDCFQDTMLAALRAYEDVRDPAAIPAWLFTIAARKAVDAHRGAVREPQARESDPTAAAAVSRAEDGHLWDQVRGLPEKQRQAVFLRYRADLTHREIAEVMDISEDAARRNVFEGLERLREDGIT